MRSSAASSRSVLPTGSSYEKPRPRRTRLIPSPEGSLRRVLTRVGVLLLVAQALLVLAWIALGSCVLARRGVGWPALRGRLAAALVVRRLLSQLLRRWCFVCPALIHGFRRLPAQAADKRPGAIPPRAG
jgi:hypothetical protein